MKAGLVYPHQLFSNHPAASGADVCILVEDPLFFRQYAFHSQKLLLHRLSMRDYVNQLSRSGMAVRTIAFGELEQSGDVAITLKRLGVTQVQLVDPCDDWLLRRISEAIKQQHIMLTLLEDPNFLTPLSNFEPYASGAKRWYFSDFYAAQRKRLNILLDSKGRPEGENGVSTLPTARNYLAEPRCPR